MKTDGQGAPLRELALFAGAGGGILGGHLLGWRCVCAVELEDYPRRVLLARQRDGMLPRFPIWDDVTTFDGLQWRGRVDVISGGFPCQDISAAGKGAGITGHDQGFGLTWPASSARYDRATASWKIHPCLFPEDLMSCSIALPRWGTMRGGELSERTMPERLTSGTGSGLGQSWPTPRVAQAAFQGPGGTGGGIYLRGAVELAARGMWPTPCASESVDNGTNWASLAAVDKGGRIARRMATLGMQETQQTSHAALNPTWVEWLMGWPPGWTDLKPLAMDKFQAWQHSHGGCSHD